MTISVGNTSSNYGFSRDMLVFRGVPIGSMYICIYIYGILIPRFTIHINYSCRIWPNRIHLFNYQTIMCWSCRLEKLQKFRNFDMESFLKQMLETWPPEVDTPKKKACTTWKGSMATQLTTMYTYTKFNSFAWLKKGWETKTFPASTIGFPETFQVRAF